MAENLVSLQALFTFSFIVHFRISQYNGSNNIKLSMSVLFCKKTNIIPGRFYEQNLLVGSFMR